MMLWCPRRIWGHRNNWHNLTIESITITIRWHNQVINSSSGVREWIDRSEQLFYLSPVLFSSSVPSSPPDIQPVDIAANTNGVQATIRHSGFDPDPRSKTHTFDENKAEILTLKLIHTHTHLQSNKCVWV
ncbi:hypothetical protein RHMOL_Rhmol13G0097800 [Rhododendron molle]|uniref:Uncharacterized protein n=1 Tax=Rhododendron molle TaxID=49168 RepID=A0ACC0L5X7_RHOML|nr:hypothetical protein RHMOL_Rhmol13G0097800 [Rhododendron molle]